MGSLFCTPSVYLAQNSYLQINGSNETENKIIDSLTYAKKHANTKLLIDEVNSFSDKLLKNGYLTSKHEEAIKVNDSTFRINYTIGLKNKFIHIYVGENFELLNLKNDTLKISLSETENFMNTTLLLLEKKGYSLARLQLINFKKETCIIRINQNVISKSNLLAKQLN